MDGSNYDDVFVGAVDNFNGGGGGGGGDGGGGGRGGGGGGRDDEGLKFGCGRVMAAKVLLLRSRKGEYGHLTGVGVLGEKEETKELENLSLP
jgi:hypothetical protein